MYSTPFAYFITFTCYGTWLHGDERGSVDDEHNRYGQEFVVPNPQIKTTRKNQMRDEPLVLDQEKRVLVENTIREVCDHRQWPLHEISVRTNHVHVVVTGNTEPDKIMRDFKAYSTKKLRETELEYQHRKIWTEGGSTRYLWNDDSVAAACKYVREQ